MGAISLEDVRRRVLEFRRQRNWEQFHDPKNLAEGLAIEAAELLENFLWKTTEESRSVSEEDRERIADEMADIFVFLLYLAEEFHIDLPEATAKKIEKNAQKYPIEKSRGSRKKYREL